MSFGSNFKTNRPKNFIEGWELAKFGLDKKTRVRLADEGKIKAHKIKHFRKEKELNIREEKKK